MSTHAGSVASVWAPSIAGGSIVGGGDMDYSDISQQLDTFDDCQLDLQNFGYFPDLPGVSMFPGNAAVQLNGPESPQHQKPI